MKMKKVSVMNESTYRNKSKQTNGETYSGGGGWGGGGGGGGVGVRRG